MNGVCACTYAYAQLLGGHTLADVHSHGVWGLPMPIQGVHCGRVFGSNEEGARAVRELKCFRRGNMPWLWSHTLTHKHVIEATIGHMAYIQPPVHSPNS